MELPIEAETFASAAAAWSKLGLRLDFWDQSKRHPLGQWKYADSAKTKLKPPMAPREAYQAVIKTSGIVRILVEPPPGIVVLDIDHRPEKGWDAKAIRAELCDRFNIGPRPMVTTPSGGYHLWLAVPPELQVRNVGAESSDFPIAGIDFKAHGSVVTVPPSYRETEPDKVGGSYHWCGDIRTPPLVSRALQDALPTVKTDAEYVAESRQRQTFDADRLSKYCASALERELAAVAGCSKGGRNNQLFQSSAALASIVAAGGLPEGPTRKALYDMAGHNGLVRSDGARAVLQTIKSGFSAGMSNPRQLPNEGAHI